MRFGVLGPLVVWTADGADVPVAEAQVRRLLAALLAANGGPVGPDALIHALWGDDPPATAHNALQAKVSRLRRVLDGAEPEGRKRLSLTPAGYRLDLSPDDVDAERFTRAVRRARSAQDPGARSTLLAEALDLWRGPVMAEFHDESFLLATAQRLDDAWLSATEDLAEARLALGDHRGVAADLADSVARYPFRERVRALRIRALYRSGQQAAAVDTYHDLSQRLREELGVDPGPELRAVYLEMLNRAPAPIPPEVAPRGNLPVPLTALIGRDAAVTELTALVTTRRLLSLVGTGGVGKTRLATETAHQIGTDAWFVDLSGLTPGTTSAATIAERVASTLDVGRDSFALPSPGTRAVDTVSRLASALAMRESLIILDNCEHVLAAAAELAQALLTSAPNLRLMATSRESLGIAGETVWMVPPLDRPPAAVCDAAVLAEFGAARLFLDRVSDAAPDFALAPAQVPAVVALCRRLDVLPLALEIAAQLIRSFTPEELSQRLDDRFRLLSRGKHGVPARQRTLRALIDWSWELLSPAEQAVMRRLSVHRTGCTAEAAEAVCAGGVVAPEDVPTLLGRLVDQSLVLAEGTDETRYRLLESIAVYGRERLAESGEIADTEARHRVHYRNLAEAADPHLRGPDQCRWLNRLDAETANMRAALDYATAAGDAEDAQRLAVALSWYNFLRGRRWEARAMLDRALRTPGAVRRTVTARARAWRAGMTMFVGTTRGEATTEVEAGFTAASDVRGLAHARWFLAFAEFGFGDLCASEHLLAKALTAFELLGDRWGTAAGLSVRAPQALFRGDIAAFHADAERSLVLFTAVGDQWGRLFALGSIGIHHEIAGDTARAEAVFIEAGGIAEELNLWPDVSTMLARRGRIAMLDRDYPRADRLLERARVLAEEHADIPARSSPRSAWR